MQGCLLCDKYKTHEYGVEKKQSLDRPWELKETEASRFDDNGHMDVVRLSALRTVHLYPPPKKKFLVLISVRGWGS